MKAFIGITSCNKNEEQRKACRQTWLSEWCGQKEWRYRFALTGSVYEWHEWDTLPVNCPDDYKHVWMKTRALMRSALELPDWTHFVKADDDSYMVIDRVLPCLVADYGGSLCAHEDVPYGSGSACYLSRRSVEIVIPKLTGYTFDDLEIGRILHAAGIPFTPDRRWSNNLNDPAQPIPAPDNDIATTHYANPERMRQLHDQWKNPNPNN